MGFITRFVTVYQFSTPIPFDRLQVVAGVHLTFRSTPAEAGKEFVQLVSLFTTGLYDVSLNTIHSLALAYATEWNLDRIYVPSVTSEY